jgi:uncharacterized protein (DUF1684 family)
MQPEAAGVASGRTSLELADWRRQVSELYAAVRERAVTDPEAAWDLWRAARETLYREHPQSPVPATARPGFRSRHWPYDPAWRFEVEVRTGDAGAAAVAAPPDSGDAGAGFGSPLQAAGAGLTLALPMSTGDALSFTRLGEVSLALPAGDRTLALYWMAGYAGGIFLPFRDATNGEATYGAGRYLLDTAKSADLGGDVAAGRLILDLNFAFHPSCAFDPRWSCPLAPPENRLDVAVEVGERLR